MVKSMTGYGTKTIRIEATQLTVEIRSVNSRYLDFIPKIPHSLHNLEADIKQVIQKNFARGRIEVYISIVSDDLSDKKIAVNWGLMDDYVHKIAEIKTRYNLTGETPLTLLTSMEDLFTVEEKHSQPDSFKEEILPLMQTVCNKVLELRKNEGEYLMKDINFRITNLGNMLELIVQKQSDVAFEYSERIKSRIENHVTEQIEINQTILIQDIALLAEKGDITEEITRLKSHLKHFTKIVESEEVIGRKLDFITQEMHREVNTIGAKSLDAQMSEAVVTMKSEIEKIKEQVQNIE